MEKITCPSCGSRVPKNSIYCGYCHARLQEEKAESKGNNSQSTNEKGRNLQSNNRYEITSKTAQDVNGEEYVPFLGDSVSELSYSDKQPHSIACGAAGFEGFEILFQQRNKLNIEIEEGLLTEKRSMDGMRAFLYPNIKDLKYNEKDLLDLYVNKPIKDQEIPENYGLIQYKNNKPINFGYILFSAPNLTFKDQIKVQKDSGEKIVNDYVIPLISDIKYDEAVDNPIPTSLQEIDINWDNIKQEFMKDDQIKFHLFTKDEDEFKWEHPVSLKIEIEDSTYTELDNFEKRKYKATALLEGSRLLKVNLIISNTTYNQVFASDLEDVQVSIRFETSFKELIQPSALIINNKNAEYLMENGTIEWIPGDLSIRQQEKLSFLIDRDIVELLDRFSIKVSGYYRENPQVFEEYTYVSPMGFPVRINKNLNDEVESVDWNPGELAYRNIDDEGRNNSSMNQSRYIYKSANCMNYRKLKNLKPTFSQEMFVSKGNLTKSMTKENYVEVLKSSCEFISELDKDFENMKGILKLQKKGNKKRG